MSKQVSWIFAVALAAAVAGCASTPTVTTQTVIVAGHGPVEIEQMNVEVAEVDPAQRRVVVRQGIRAWTVEVPEIFGDLQNLRPGDRVQIRRVEGVILGMRRARKGAEPGIVYAEAASNASFQNLPERFVVRSLTVTARFQAFDAATGSVSYIGPWGPRSLIVVDAAIKRDLARLRSGDMVDLTFAEAVYIQKY
jgi:hypothetical protein